MSKQPIDVRVVGPNALRIEHERDDVRADRDRGVVDILNDAGVSGVVSIFGSGFSEQLPRAASGYVCTSDDEFKLMHYRISLYLDDSYRTELK